jgi:hypothetical protein
VNKEVESVELWEWIVLAVAIGAALILLVAFVSIRRRRGRLSERFGPEYQRAVSSSGRGDAERRLREVEKEHDELDIRSLTPAARERYRDEWHQAEARFVSDPRDAARAAERVVSRMLDERGYPVDRDPDDQAAYVAADYPDVAERFRHGHAMLESVDGAQGTENLRRAMLDFRAVFEEVMEERTAA